MYVTPLQRVLSRRLVAYLFSQFPSCFLRSDLSSGVSACATPDFARHFSHRITIGQTGS
jgi:hypothetical protein